MKALILAGGYGTRLHPITLRTSKSVLPIAGIPNIIHIFKNLKSAGIKDVVISLNKNQESVRNVLGDGKRFGINLEYVMEETSSDEDKLGAIGAIRYVIETVGTDDYVVIGADNFFHGLDIEEMIKFHKKTKSDATVALFELGDKSLVSNYGIAVLDKERIIAFQEKPRIEDALSTLASTAVYIMNKNFLDANLPEYLESNKDKHDRPGDLWVHFAKKLNIGGFSFSGFWGDIGNAGAYLKSNKSAMEMLEENISENAKISEYAELAGENIQVEEGVVIEEDVIIRGPVVLKKNCIIRKGSVVGPYVLVLRETEISEGCEITNSVVFERVNIGSGVKISGSIIDGKSVISDNCVIESNSIVGYGSRILKNSKISESSRVWPHIILDEETIVDGDVMSETGLIKDTYYFEDD